MAKSKYHTFNTNAQSKGHFIAEKFRVEQHFPGFRCEIKRNHLLCQGVITPAEGCDSYHIKIDYAFLSIPLIYITNPKITPNIEYHMYGDGSLCLYDHREAPWSAKLMLHETIIPWTAEWIVFYELWKITGEWLGSAALHDVNKKILEANTR